MTIYFNTPFNVEPDDEDVLFVSTLPGNNEGGLYICEFKGRFYWSISYCGEMDWHEINRDLYSEIKKLQEQNG